MTSPTPSFLKRISDAIAHWAAEQRQREQDARYWETAMADPRVMADINCALARSDGESAARTIVVPDSPELSGFLAASHAVSH